MSHRTWSVAAGSSWKWATIKPPAWRRSPTRDSGNPPGRTATCKASIACWRSAAFDDRTRDMSDCLFCQIGRKEIPAGLIYEDGDLFVIKDINPQAPLHALVIPRKHIPTLN